MFRAIFLLCCIYFAVSADAQTVQVNKPFITLPISRRINVTSVHNLVRHDQSRLQALNLKRITSDAALAGCIINEEVDNQAIQYIASVGIGNPATTYQLIVDTGSSNTWVGAGKAYVKTSTSVQTTSKVAVTYGAGSFVGTEFTDSVTLFPGQTISKQSIGVASSSTGFSGVDGILGIGPVDLTLDTLSPGIDSSIPTVTDNLFAQGIISANSVALSFEPTTQESVVNGEISWGGTDSSKFTGSIIFNPITTTSPSNEFWGINLSIRYGASNSLLSTTAGSIDSGTSLLLIATDAFTKYQAATGAVLDNNTGLLRLTTTQFANLQTLSFITAGGTFQLTPNAQLWPRSLNADIGGTSGALYLIVADLGTNSGQGLDFILGFTFLERFYTVFDTANKRVGIATTAFTTATTN